MPQLNSSALGVLSDSTVSSLHGSVLNNDSVSPNLSCVSESVLENTSNNLSIRQLNDMSFLERVKAASNMSDLSEIFSRGSLDDLRLKKKRRKPKETKLNPNDSLKSSDSSSSSNLDDSFFKKPNVPCPKSTRKRQHSASTDSMYPPDKSSIPEENVEPSRIIKKGNKETHSRKVSVNLTPDSSSESINESLENIAKEINPSPESLPNKKINTIGRVTISDEKELSSDISQDISNIGSQLDSTSNELEFTSVVEMPCSKQLQNKKSSRRVSVKLADLLDNSEIEDENSINTPEKSITSSAVNISLSESDSINLEESVHDEVKVNNQSRMKTKRISVHFPLDDSVAENFVCNVTQSSDGLQTINTKELIDNVPQEPLEVPERQLENKLTQLKQRKSILRQSSRNSTIKCKSSENNDEKSLEISDANSKPCKSSVKFNTISATTDNSDSNIEQKKPALRRGTRKSVTFSADIRNKSSEEVNKNTDKISVVPLAQNRNPGSMDSHLNIEKSNKDNKTIPPMIVQRLSDLDTSSDINISDISGLTNENRQTSSGYFGNDNSTVSSLSLLSEEGPDGDAKDSRRKISSISNLTFLSDKTFTHEEGQDSVKNSTLKDQIKSRRVSVHVNLDNASINESVQDRDKKNNETIPKHLQPEENLSTDPSICVTEANNESLLKDLRKRCSTVSNLTLLSSESLNLTDDEVIDDKRPSCTSSKVQNKSRRVSVQNNLDEYDKKTERAKSLHNQQPEENLSEDRSGVTSSSSSTNGLMDRVSADSNLTLLSNETLNLSEDPESDDETNHSSRTSNDKLKSKKLHPKINLNKDLSVGSSETCSPSTKGHLKRRVSNISNLSLLSNETLNLSEDPLSENIANLSNKIQNAEMKYPRICAKFNLEETADESEDESKENNQSLCQKLQQEESVSADCTVGSGEGNKSLKGRVSSISNLTLLTNETLNLSEDPVSHDATLSNRTSNYKMKSKRVSVQFNLEDTVNEEIVQEEKENNESLPKKHQQEENLSGGCSFGSGEASSPSSTKDLKRRVSALSNLTLLSNETLNLTEEPASADETNHIIRTSHDKMKSKRVSVHFNFDDTTDDESVREQEKENNTPMPTKLQPEENQRADRSVGSEEISSPSSNKILKGRVSAISNLTLLSYETLNLSEDRVSDIETKHSSRTSNVKMKSKRVSVHFNLEDTADEEIIQEEKKNNESSPEKHQPEENICGDRSIGPGAASSPSSNNDLRGSRKTRNDIMKSKRVSVHFNLEKEEVQEEGKENNPPNPNKLQPEENLSRDCSVSSGETSSTSSFKDLKGRVSAASNLTLLSNETLNLSEDRPSADETNHDSTTSNVKMKSKRVSVHFNLENTADKESIQEEEEENNPPKAKKFHSQENQIADLSVGSEEISSPSSNKISKGSVSTISNLTLLTNETLNLSEDIASDDETNHGSRTSNDKMNSKRVSVHFNLENTADDESVQEEGKECNPPMHNKLQPEENQTADCSLGSEELNRPSSNKSLKGRVSAISNLTLLSNETLNLSEDSVSDGETNHSSRTSNVKMKSKRVSVHFNLEDTADEVSIQEEGKENNPPMHNKLQPEENQTADCSLGSGEVSNPSSAKDLKGRVSAISNLTLLTNETLNLSEDTASADETNHGSRTSNVKMKSKRVSVHFNLENTADEESVQEEEENNPPMPNKLQPEENLSRNCSFSSGESSSPSSAKDLKGKVSAIPNLTLLTNETLNLTEDTTSDDETSHSSRASNVKMKSKRVSVHFNLENTADEESVQEEEENNPPMPNKLQPEENLSRNCSFGSGESSSPSSNKSLKGRISAISNLTLLSNETLNLTEDPISDDETNHSSRTSNVKMKSKRVSVHFNLEDTADEVSVQEEGKENTPLMPNKLQPEENQTADCSLGSREASNPSSAKDLKGRVSAISNLTLLTNETLNLSEDTASADETNHGSRTSNVKMKSKRVSVHFNLENTADEESVQEEEENNPPMPKKLQPEENLSRNCSFGSGESSSPSSAKDLKGKVSAIPNLTLLTNETLNLTEDTASDDETNHSSRASNVNMKSKRVSVHFNLENTADEESVQEEEENYPPKPNKLQPDENLSRNGSFGSGESSSPSSNKSLKGRVSAISNLTLLSNETLNLSEDPISDDETNHSSRTSNVKMKSKRVSVHFNLEDTADEVSVQEERKENTPLMPNKLQPEENQTAGCSLCSGEASNPSSAKDLKGRVSAISNLTLLTNETLNLSEDPVSHDATLSNRTSNYKMKSKRVSVQFNLEDTVNEEIIREEKENNESLPKKHQQEENLSRNCSFGSGESSSPPSAKDLKGRFSAISNLTLLTNETLNLSEDPVSDDKTNHSCRTSNAKMKSKRVSVHFSFDETGTEENIHDTEDIKVKSSLFSGDKGNVSSLIKDSNGKFSSALNETYSEPPDFPDSGKTGRVSALINCDDTATEETVEGKKIHKPLPNKVQSKEEMVGGSSPVAANGASSIKDFKGRVSTLSNFSLLSNETLTLVKDPVSDLDTKPVPSKVLVPFGFGVANVGNDQGKINEGEKYFSNDLQPAVVNNMQLECIEKPIQQKPRKSILRRSTRKSSVSKLSEDCNFITHESPKINSDNAKTHKRLRKSVTFSADATIKTTFNTEYIVQNNFDELEESGSLVNKVLVKDQSVANMPGFGNKTSDIRPSNVFGPTLNESNELTNVGIDKSSSNKVSIAFGTSGGIENKSFSPDYPFSTNKSKILTSLDIENKDSMSNESAQKNSPLISIDSRKSVVHISKDVTDIDEMKLNTKTRNSGLNKTYFGQNDCMELTMMRKSIALDKENITNRTNYKSLGMEEDLSLANVNVNNHLDETRRTLAGMDFTVINSDNSPFEEDTSEETSFATTINREDLPNTNMEITLTGIDTAPMPPNTNNMQGFGKKAEINGVCSGEQERTVSHEKNKGKFSVEKHSKRSSIYANKMSDECSKANSGTDSPVNDNLLNAANVKIKQKEVKCCQVSQKSSKKARTSEKDLSDMSISQVSDIELTAHSTEKSLEQTMHNSMVSKSCSSNFSFDEDIPSSTLIDSSKTFIEDKTNLSVKESKILAFEENKKSNKYLSCDSSGTYKKIDDINSNSNNKCQTKYSYVNDPGNSQCDRSLDVPTLKSDLSTNEATINKVEKRISVPIGLDSALASNNKEADSDGKLYTISGKVCQSINPEISTSFETKLDGMSIRSGSSVKESNINLGKKSVSVHIAINDADATNSTICETSVNSGKTKGRESSLKGDITKISKISSIQSCNKKDIDVIGKGKLASDQGDDENHLQKSMLKKKTRESSLKKNTQCENSDMLNYKDYDQSILLEESNLNAKKCVTVSLDNSENDSYALEEPGPSEGIISLHDINEGNIPSKYITKESRDNPENTSVPMSTQSPENVYDIKESETSTSPESEEIHADNRDLKKPTEENKKLKGEGVIPSNSSLNKMYLSTGSTDKPHIESNGKNIKGRTAQISKEKTLEDTNQSITYKRITRSFLKGSTNDSNTPSAISKEENIFKFNQSSKIKINCDLERERASHGKSVSLESNNEIQVSNSGVNLSLDKSELNPQMYNKEIPIPKKISVNLDKSELSNSSLTPTLQTETYSISSQNASNPSLKNETFSISSHTSSNICAQNITNEVTNDSNVKSTTTKSYNSEENGTKKRKVSVVFDSTANSYSNESSKNTEKYNSKALTESASASHDLEFDNGSEIMDVQKTSLASTLNAEIKEKKKHRVSVHLNSVSNSLSDCFTINTNNESLSRTSTECNIQKTSDGDSDSFLKSSETKMTRSNFVVNSTYQILRKDKNINRHVSVILDDTPTQSTIADCKLSSTRTLKETSNEGKKSLNNVDENTFKEVEEFTAVSNNTVTLDNKAENNLHVSVGNKLDNTSIQRTISDLAEFDDQKTSGDSSSLKMASENGMTVSNIVADSTDQTLKKDGKVKRHVSVVLEDTSSQPTLADYNISSTKTLKETLSEGKESLNNVDENKSKEAGELTTASNNTGALEHKAENNRHVSVGITMDNTSIQPTISDLAEFDDQKTSGDSSSFKTASANEMTVPNIMADSTDRNLKKDGKVIRHVSVVLEDTSSQPTFADCNISSIKTLKETFSEGKESLNNVDEHKSKNAGELTTSNNTGTLECNRHVSVGITMVNTSIQPTISDLAEFNDQKTSGDSSSFKKLAENKMTSSNIVADSTDQNLRKDGNVNRHVSVVLEDTTSQLTILDSNITSSKTLMETVFKGKKSPNDVDENKCKEVEEFTNASNNTGILGNKAENNRHVSVGITLDNTSIQPTICDSTKFDIRKTYSDSSSFKESELKIVESDLLMNSTNLNLKNDGNVKKHLSVFLEDQESLHPTIVDNNLTGTRTPKETLKKGGKKSQSKVQGCKINEVEETSAASNNTETLNKNTGNNQHVTVGLVLDNTPNKLTTSNLNGLAGQNSCAENKIIESNLAGDSTDQILRTEGNVNRRVSVVLGDTCILRLQHSTIESVPLIPPPLISDILNSDDLSKEIDPIELDTSNCDSLIARDLSGRAEQDNKSTSIQGDNSTDNKDKHLSNRNPISARKKSTHVETSTEKVTRNSLKKRYVSNASIKSQNSSIKKQNISSSKKTLETKDSLKSSPKILAQCPRISDTKDLIPNVSNMDYSDDLLEPKALPLKHNSPCINSPDAERVSLVDVSPGPNTSNFELNVTLDGSIRSPLPESLSDSNEKVIHKRKSPRNTVIPLKSDETKGEKPYSLRKSSPNLTQNVSLKRKRKSVTFGQNTYKNASSGDSSSETNTKHKTRTSNSNDSERGLQVSSGVNEHVFIRPDFPVRKSGSLSITKRSRNCLEEDTSNDQSSGASKRKKNSDKTINELSYDTSLDMSEIPRDERLLHKKLIYHSTPINTVLERRKKKKSNKKSEGTEVKDGHSDKMIQVSEGFGTSSDTAISKVRAPLYHSQVGDVSLSTQNQRHIKKKETSSDNQTFKRKKCIEEDKSNKVFSSGSGGYSTAVTDMDSPPLPRHQVQFRQNVHFKGITSESSSGIERNQSVNFSEISGRSYLSDSFYSSLSQNNTSLPLDEIPKKVKFREDISHPSISSISLDMNGSSNLQNKVRTSRLTQGSDRSKLTSTRIEEESERQETQNVSVALSELPTIASECLSKRLVMGPTIFPSQRKKTKLRNIETSIMPLLKKEKTQKYDFKNDLRFNIDNKPFTCPRIKFPAKWVSNELFKFLKGKLESSLKEEAPNMALRIISHLCAAEASIQRLNSDDDIELLTLVLRKLLVKYNICSTQLEYGLFLINYTPFSFHTKLTKIIIHKNLKVSDSIVHEAETIDIDF